LHIEQNPETLSSNALLVIVFDKEWFVWETGGGLDGSFGGLEGVIKGCGCEDSRRAL